MHNYTRDYKEPRPGPRCEVCADRLIRVTGKGWVHEQELRHGGFIYGLLKKVGPHKPQLMRRARI